MRFFTYVYVRSAHAERVLNTYVNVRKKKNASLETALRVDFQCCVFFDLRVRMECPEHVNLFIDAY